MSIRTEEQVQEQAAENVKYQPTANDVIQAAVQEGKDRAEAQEDDTEATLNRIKAMEKGYCRGSYGIIEQGIIAQ